VDPRLRLAALVVAVAAVASNLALTLGVVRPALRRDGEPLERFALRPSAMRDELRAYAARSRERGRPSHLPALVIGLWWLALTAMLVWVAGGR
jgi:hypothetical protein